VPDELAQLLEAGERAAFHGRPAAGVSALQRATLAAQEAGRPAEATAAAWLLGVNLSAAGRFGSALQVLEPLATVDGDQVGPERRLFGALAASSVASVHRQLGRHSVARAYDEQALTLSGGEGEAGFDARLGLASDAVGLDDADSAETELDGAATMAADRSDWWRQRVRVSWVRAEVALLRSDHASAHEHATAAVAGAEAAQAPRHVAKSLLFLGVAQVHAGELAEAASTLRRAATLAESLGTLPLLWPSRAMLGALVADSAPQESASSLAAAKQAVTTIADDLPDDLRAEWLVRPDVEALIAG
jgi:tetratricopeptide (TPR) repeat protein